MVKYSTAIAALVSSAAADSFNPLHHLGGNSPYFSGPDVFDISPNAPQGCVVDQAAFTSRHGSRYPDPGSYNQWVALAAKVGCNIHEHRSLELTVAKDSQPDVHYQGKGAPIPADMAAGPTESSS